MTSKAAWRRWATALSRQPTEEENTSLLEALTAFLTQHGGVVLTYRPMPHEPDIDQLIEDFGADRFLTTRTPPDGGLTIHRLGGTSERHKYGFLQPVSGTEEVNPDEVDIVLVPGVLFGRDGSRLGHGMAYYDRLLATCRDSVLRVATARESHVVATLPSDAHDVAMTHLATELGGIVIGPK